MMLLLGVMDTLGNVLTITGFIGLILTVIAFVKSKANGATWLTKVRKIDEGKFFESLKNRKDDELYFVNFKGATFKKVISKLKTEKLELDNFKKVSVLFGTEYLKELDDIFKQYRFSNVYSIEDDTFVNLLVIFKPLKGRYYLYFLDSLKDSSVFTCGVNVKNLDTDFIRSFKLTKIESEVAIDITRLFHEIYSNGSVALNSLGALLSYKSNSNVTLRDSFLGKFQEEILTSPFLKKLITTDLTYDPKHTLSRLSFIKTNRRFIEEKGNALTRVFIICSEENYRRHNPIYESYDEYLLDIFILFKLQYKLGINVKLSNSRINDNPDKQFDVIKYVLDDNKVLSLVQEKIPKSSYAKAEATLYNHGFKFGVIDYHMKNSIEVDVTYLDKQSRKVLNDKSFEEHYKSFIKKENELGELL